MKNLVSQYIVGPDFSSKLWRIAVILMAVGALCAFLAYRVDGNYLMGVSFATLGILMVKMGWKTNVSAKPQHVALVTCYGEPQDILVGPGDYMTADYLPFEIGLIPIDVTRLDVEFAPFSVTCKATDKEGKQTAGGSVDVKVDLTIEPDHEAKDDSGRPIGPQRMKELIKSGLMNGVRSIVEGMTKEAMRGAALFHTWEQFLFLKLPLSVQLITMIANTKMAELPRDASGKVDEAQIKRLGITATNYEAKTQDGTLKAIDDPVAYFLEAGAGLEAKEQRAAQREVEKEIEFFLNTAVANGVGDVRQLGVKITRFNVARLTPDAVMLLAQNKAAAEDAEKRAEDKDSDAELEQALKLVAASEKSSEKTKESIMTLTEALDRVQARRGTAKKVIVQSSGNSLLDAAVGHNATKNI
ncbi:MAG: hypothetical protein KBC38_00160 [Candidatus Pacebacteria bacterium]|nr:hypothetical protein [Candidatus Paceibacterota bacterium]MBP9840416.1 hypothetical protein [Candidatus Paceibacterota bacterium]